MTVKGLRQNFQTHLFSILKNERTPIYKVEK